MDRMLKHLVFVSDAPHFGGAERYIISMAQAAHRRGLDSGICWFRQSWGDADVFAKAREDNLRVVQIDAAAGSGFRRQVHTFNGLLKEFKPDGLIINASGRPRHWILPWLAWRAGIPSVWVHQMVDACDHRRLAAKWLGGRMEGLGSWRVPQALRHRLAAVAATAVVTLNPEDRDRIARWQGVSPAKIFPIPHGVDCDRFEFDAAAGQRWRRRWGIVPDGPCRPLIVGSAGRLASEKGMDLLIEAAAIAHGRGLPLFVVIAGQGDQQGRLGRLAVERGVADRISFVSFVDDMPAFCSALDVFVLCSRTESFGLALAEAMACRRPVIATPTSGAMRQLEHMRNGWQLKSFEPAELAEALLAVSRDERLREQMGRAGRETVVSQFSIDLTLERTLRALDGPAPRRSRSGNLDMSSAPPVSMAVEDCA